MRRALLFGLDNYNDPALNLTAPARDVDRLAEVLSRVGYAHDAMKVCLSSGSGPALTTPTLRRAIRSFLMAAGAEDDVLVYVSGHGIEQEGHRLVVPVDYYPDEPLAASALLGDQQMYALARECPARSVVYIVDACREGVRLQLAPDTRPTKGLPSPVGLATTPSIEGRMSPSIAILYSCAAGEVSCVDDKDLSYFTQVLCEVLEHDEGVAALREIVERVQPRLSKRLEDGCRQPQTVSFDERPMIGRGGDPWMLLVKEDVAARSRLSIRESAWCRSLESLDIWRRLDEAPALRDQVAMVVMRAERQVHEALRGCPAQRWVDLDAPLRVLRRLALLLGSSGVDQMPPGEAAVSAVIPFVYEAVLAEGHLLLAPQGLREDHAVLPTAERASLAMRSELFSDGTHARRRRLLRSKGNEEAADDLLHWQLLRFLHASGELWEVAGHRGVGWIGRPLTNLLAPAPFPSVVNDPRAMRVMEPRRLLRLARMSIANFEDIEMERGRGRLERSWIGEGKDGLCIDEGALAHLLSLAMMSGIDGRRLSPLLVEHIGVAPELHARRLVDVLASAEWVAEGEGWSLSFTCPHEVIDAALEELLAQMHLHLSRLPSELAIRVLPRRVDSARLRAAPGHDGHDLYQKPHLRLTQDEARIRELLMGTALYGDSQLALRELYQNALDACRYRRARVAYLQKSGLAVENYRGQITFAIGEESGSPFIECRDNGIGMSERHLRRLFARAGRRFTDSHEFHLEKAAWEEAGLSFHANSRFGIGVYSYFMLADEVRVTTRRLSEDGVNAEPPLTAEVLADGQIFRVRAVGQALVGTAVRLFLPIGSDPASLLDSLAQWLWVPEFNLRLERGDRVDEFRAREIIQSGPWKDVVTPCIPIPGCEDEWSNPRLFWQLDGKAPDRKLPVPEGRRGRSAALSDGIFAAAPFVRNASVPNSLPYLLVNMTAEIRPQLSVDRLNITEWANARIWAFDSVHQNGWRNLLDAPGLDLETLLTVINDYPAVAAKTDRALRNGFLSCVVRTTSLKSPSSIRIDPIGLSELDWLILHFIRLTGHNVDEFIEIQNQLFVASSPLFDSWLLGRMAGLRENGLVLPRNLEVLTNWRPWPKPPFGCSLAIVNNMREELSAGDWSKHNLVRAMFRMSMRTSVPIPQLLEWMQPASASLGHLATLLESLGLSLPSPLHVALLNRAKPAPADAKEAFSCPPAFVLLATAERLSVSLEEVIAAVRSLEPLMGAPSVEQDTLNQQLMDGFASYLLDLTDEELIPIADDGDVSIATLVVIAGNRRCTLGEVWSNLHKAERFGLKLPSLPETVANQTPPALVLRLYSRDLDGRKPFTSTVPLVRIGEICEDEGWTYGGLRDALGEWAELPGLLTSVTAEMHALTSDVLRTIGGLHAIDDLWSEDFEMPAETPRAAIIRLAAENRISVRDAKLQLSVFGIDDSKLDDRLLEVIPSTDDIPAITNQIVTWRMMAHAFREYPGDASERFQRWQSWGLTGDWHLEEVLPLLADFSRFCSPSDQVQSITPLQLAFFSDMRRRDVEDWIDSLHLLAAHGWDVSEALTFATDVRSHPSSTTAVGQRAELQQTSDGTRR